MMIAFGPVPSRRLGLSLGINHIPYKICPYSCVYCQVGRTKKLSIKREDFYPVKQIVDEARKKIEESKKAGITIDYVTLVPDGEPTLDANLKEIIAGLKEFQLPIAIISNTALIFNDDVQKDLLVADWVSLKVDSVLEKSWRKINRPHHHVQLSQILDGMLKFRSLYKGLLVTETMFVSGVNDSELVVHELVEFLKKLQPAMSYLSIPTRPPAENWVKPPSFDVITRILKQMDDIKNSIDLLMDTDSTDFPSSGSLEDDILGITAVHPMNEESLQRMVMDSGGEWGIVLQMIKDQRLMKVEYQQRNYYIKKF